MILVNFSEVLVNFTTGVVHNFDYPLTFDHQKVSHVLAFSFIEWGSGEKQ